MSIEFGSNVPYEGALNPTQRRRVREMEDVFEQVRVSRDQNGNAVIDAIKPRISNCEAVVRVVGDNPILNSLQSKKDPGRYRIR